MIKINISKIILGICVLLLVPISVLASLPQFSVTESLEEDVVNGVNDIGDLIFVEQTYTPENYTFNNFSVLNLQQYDRATWKGNGTIVIKSPTNNDTTVVVNDSYIFPLDGTYSFKLLSDNNISSSIIASRYDNIDISIEIDSQPNGFYLTFSDTSFTLNNERVIAEELEIDDDVATGEYEIDILINNISYTQDFTVGSNKQWRIKEKTVNSSIDTKSGDNLYLGYFLLENTGNSDVEITISKNGTDNFIIGIPQPQTLYKKSTLRIELQLQIPTSFSPGTYEYTVKLSGGKNNVTQDIIVVVDDAIKPRIESINFSTNKAYKENEIVVIATDNDAVSNVTLEYGSNTVYLKKDGQKFTYKMKFDKLSQYILTFCAIDNTDNSACIDVNKTFVRTELIKGNKNQIKLPSKKIGKYSTIVIFNLTESISDGVAVELVEFVALNIVNQTDSYSVRLIDGDDTVKRFTKYDTEQVISRAGEIKLEVRSEVVADYSGILRLIVPDYAEEISDIRFTVSFKEYDIPEDFTKDWIDDRKLICTVVDTGNLDSSYFDCNLRFPIDTRPEEISVPTTVAERDAFKSEAVDVEDKLKIFKRRSAVFITLLMVALILSGGIVWYALYQRPYVRFTFGHKLKNRYDNEGKLKKN